MRCASCGNENPDRAKFCLECGAAFASRCPRCGTELPASAKFCLECGAAVSAGISAAPERSPRDYTPNHLAEKILQSKSALEGERKQVTVLFADVKGSLELAEQVDAEEWHRILDRFFQILADGVHRFEGTVNQYTGDGVMALFGAPIAHEDHAQRACYAALHLRDELRSYGDELRLDRGISFAVRIGINSGEVIVGKIGADLRMDYTAQGQTVGLAARMQQIAEPGKVYLTQYAARLVDGFFELRDLGQSKVRGAADPLRVYELEAVGPLRTRLDVARLRGFSRFVGRADEMAALEMAFSRAVEGNGQVVGVVGEAGVGKSRLCLEFAERCRADGIPVHDAHCPSHGRAVPFLPALELFRNYFGISDRDRDEEARRKIAGTLLLLDEAFRDVLPLLFDFLGVSDPKHPAPRMDPEARQRQLFEFVRRLIRARSEREPAVTLVDDLHWIDAGSDAFLAQLVDAVKSTRTMLLVNFRPEYRAEWVGKSHYHQIPLAPLGPEAIAELLSELLGDEPTLVGLRTLIRERTGGNPFFIEEVVQSLIESGTLEGTSGRYRMTTSVERLELPSTVESVVAARMDRLPEREKRVLQTAAVIGREFSEPILEAVAELSKRELADALAGLKDADFLRDHALYPVAEYAFKHPLTQEVALGSQLQDRRQRVHGAVARAIEQANPGRLDEEAALLAHHWEEAGEVLEAARWHCRAAEWAGTSHLTEALRHWQRVRTLLGTIAESAETAPLALAARIQILNIGWRLGVSEEEGATIFSEGEALAERAGDLRALVNLTSVYGSVRGLAGNAVEYVSYALKAAHLAEPMEDAGLRAAFQAGVVIAYWWAGRFREALPIAEQCLRQTREDPKLGSELRGFSPHVFLLWIRAAILAGMGKPAEASAGLDRAADLAREHDEAENLVWILGAFVQLAGITGRAEGAVQHALRAVEIAEKTGSTFSRVSAYMSLGVAHLVSGEWSQAAAASERALEIARETGAGLLSEAAVLASLAQAYLGLGDHRRARAAADEAVSVGRRRGTRSFERAAHLARARVLVETEGATARAEIESDLSEAMTLIGETGERAFIPFLYEERACLAGLDGDEATCQSELRHAHRLYTEMGATGHAERLAKELSP